MTGWLAAVEGYYGRPLEHDDRVELVEWLGTQGFDGYAYAPKHDPYHRDRWRDPYPRDEQARFAELIAAGAAAGVQVAMAVSPGLDWRGTAGDEAALVAKVCSFRELGSTAIGVAFDDVDPGGADLGAAHGRAVAAAVAGVGDPGVRWFTCPTDYATPVVTPYLRAFVAELPEAVDILWTGPSIVTPTLTGAEVRAFAAELGRKPIFAENYPVNDGGMEGVLHLGPYPDRSPDVVAECAGAVCNFMRHPRASRIGLAAAARFWRDPQRDRWEAWREVINEVPGIEALALASCMWVGRPDPAPELVEWFDAAVATRGADGRLREYLQAGCRDGLDPALAAEVEPWLDSWDRQSHAMQWALMVLAAAESAGVELSMALVSLWQRARAVQAETFGVRWAGYPVTTWDGAMRVVPGSIVTGDNLTDRLCKAALGVARPTGT